MKTDPITLERLINDKPMVNASHFKECGFCDVRNFLTPAMVTRLQQLLASTDAGDSFDSIKKNAYNIGLDDEAIREIVESSAFAGILKSLGYGDCFFSDGIVFETDPELIGFDWHLDITSFKYIQPEDRAFSIWIPLDPIDRDEQDGGMTMLPISSFSGSEFFKLQSRVTRALVEGQYKIPDIYKTLLGPKYRNPEQKRFKKLFPYIQEQFPHLFSDSIYISGFSRYLFDCEGVSYSLVPGDAVLFDKTVFHKSNPLRPGTLKTRRAFVMRFIETTSRYNAVNASKAGGDDSILVSRYIRGDGEPFDLEGAALTRIAT
ncbi:hypothetical protein ACK3Z8_19795 [Aeromonas caviae]|uniref:hypothetical protein n=1 Tax=Aeromonas TaxID=642 RepID=UPI0029D5BCDF|nr:hypothetical protein [Aeromonas caviae]MDX7821329.1 hypothetical protein [Aeromonas caviae]MDX7822726.1 hypothetical protein [Aeromonas caviae]